LELRREKKESKMSSNFTHFTKKGSTNGKALVKSTTLLAEV
jgi:hypothetical protein